MSILSIQSDMLDEKKYGPILRQSKGVISSLEQTDFILAATIICLELSSGSSHPPHTQVHPKFTRTDLLEALHLSHCQLGKMKDVSKDSQQAYEIVSRILRRSGVKESFPNAQQAVDSATPLGTRAQYYVNGDQSTRSIDVSEIEDSGPTSTQTQTLSGQSPFTIPDHFSPSFFDTSGIESFFDDPHSADWVSC